MFKIAKFLGVDAKWLIGGQSDQEKAQRSADAKEPGISQSACVVRDDSPIYGAQIAQQLSLDERVERLEKVLEAILKALHEL